MSAVGYTISRERAKELSLDQLHNSVRRLEQEVEQAERDIRRRQASLHVLQTELSAHRDENVEREAVLERQAESRREAQRKLARAARSRV